ncbi:fibronectin type III-like domain-contianing protein, partial [Longimicrobium sp.]|uniref:fibronectin type III-like domain-contianing protein n=1 Tax=Longimicrobium sp. TaxID=2029185 RepID=UPI002E317362
ECVKIKATLTPGLEHGRGQTIDFNLDSLAPGETRTVAIDIGPEQLAFWGIEMRRVVEPGEFEVRVGSSSRDEDLRTVILRVR